MRILVDTSVWSLALRRKETVDDPWSRELEELIRELRACMIGPVRQELLSGIRSQEQFAKLKQRLSAFPDLVLASEDYERAAWAFNLCRSQGIQGSNTDFLICAVAERRDLSVLTSDHDFTHYSRVLGISLHPSRFAH